MAGFFGLFGGKTKYVDEPTPVAEESEKKDEAFFLEPDQAKTLGNIDYMRQPNTIEHTFPKTRSSEGKAVTWQISSMEKKRVAENAAAPSVTPEVKPQTPSQTTPTSEQRRTADSSMDMFRKMAREIKK
jgi:hypothetical protein